MAGNGEASTALKTSKFTGYHAFYRSVALSKYFNVIMDYCYHIFLVLFIPNSVRTGTGVDIKHYNLC
jgi:hypothetical protein